MNLPTLTDVARAAGVSYATVDRVVNRRGSVSEKAKQKVNAAVVHLGYIRNVAAANLSQKRTYRFVFLLPDGANAFFQTIRRLIKKRQESAENTSLDYINVPAFDEAALRAQLAELRDQKLDGIAVVGLDAKGLAPELAALQGQGIPVVSLISDLPQDQRVAYIGIDNIAAGQTAARLLGLAHGGQSGQVQVLAGDLAARDHRDRLDGFQHVIGADFPTISLLPLIAGRDDSALIKQAMANRLATHPGITAIYSLGAGNQGLIDALRAQAQRPLVAVHELVAHARDALADGMFHFVIDQRPEEEVDAVLAQMRALIDNVPPPPIKPILPAIYLRDNLPPLPEQEPPK